VGCGSYPAFLVNTKFGERYGIDRLALADVGELKIKLVEHDIADGSPLPFESSFFEVVTMLAVFEHIEPSALQKLLLEIRRVLRPGGHYVMTTPVRWTEGILKAMSRARLVSQEEVGEHKAQYSAREVRSLLLEAGFEASRLRHGTFELGLNVWAMAQVSD
jgi:SAM-dependent methyltransferase